MSELLDALRCDRGGCACHASARRGKGLTHCPAHDDYRPSLSVFSGSDGQRAWDCKAGCDWLAVTKELEVRGLVHSIRGHDGHLAAIHERKGRWVQADGRLGLGGTSSKDLLFGAELLRDAAGRNVILAEGEKCADALRALGFVAVATVCGAASVPSRKALGPLAGFTVYLWPDSDEAGRRHMHRIAGILRELGCQVFLIEWSEAPEHGDVADLVAELGLEHARAAVETLIAEAVELQAARPTADSVGVLLSDVQPERVRWLWSGRIPLGKLTVLDGDPGLGKSTLTLDLAARVTTGRVMPDGSPGVEGGVVVLTAEDGLADTVRPRLDAAGGDPARVVALPVVGRGDQEHEPVLPDDLGAVESAIARVGAVLVIVDPLMAYLSGAVNANRDQDVRRALRLCASLAERTGVAVLVVRHLTKMVTPNPLYRGGGSIGIIGAARAGLLVARDPDDETRRVLAISKCNLALEPPSLAFELSSYDDGRITGVARVHWHGIHDATAASLLAAPESDEERSQLGDAVDLLDSLLVAGGWVSTQDLQREARAAGVSWRTMERAKVVRRARASKVGKVWGWVIQVSASPPGTLDGGDGGDGGDGLEGGQSEFKMPPAPPSPPSPPSPPIGGNGGDDDVPGWPPGPPGSGRTALP